MAATSSITTFRKDNNGIIYDLPSGKMVIEEGKEKRVKIEPSQGTCFYAAMSRLFHTASALKKDQFYSQYLPTLLNRIAKLETFVSQRLFYPKTREFYQQINKDFAQNVLAVYHDPESKQSKLILAALGEDGKHVDRYFPAEELKGFIQSSSSSFFDYSWDKYFTEKRNAYSQFLKNVCEPALFSQMQQDTSSLLPAKTVEIFQSYTQALIANDYGFKPSNWEPKKAIDSLLEELRNKGPLVMGGNFGRSYYEKPPEEVANENLSEKVNTYYWNSKTNKRLETPRSHVVIVIGAIKHTEAQGGGVVYFLDPNDPSDPAASKYNIYKISYENLKNNAGQFELMGGYAVYL